MYILDFLLNFVMAYEDTDKKIEVRFRYIIVNYFKNWFLFDFLACIPFQYIQLDDPSSQEFNVNTDSSKMYKIFRVLRLLKLVRLVKYNRSINRILAGFRMNQGFK
jgi:hypothetical protein